MANIIVREEMITGITSIYDEVARQLDYDPDKVKYDCRKIEVSERMYDKINKYYKDKGVGDLSFAMDWCCYGPKVDTELCDMEVHIEYGFIVESE